MPLEAPMKEIAKIGKATLLSAVGYCRNYKKEYVVEQEGNAICPRECIFKNSSTPCPIHQVESAATLSKTIYINEKHRYKIKEKDILEEKRLSKYQLAQFILYHFLNVDSNGFARYITVKQVASIIGCSTRTVTNNNRVLAKLGLIAYTKLSPEYFNVVILGYKQYHLRKEEGGTGYIQMPKEFLQGILKLKHTNEIRIAIRKYHRFDDDVIVKKGSECVLTYNDIKHFMPTNISYKKAILRTMEPAREFFDIITKDRFVIFHLKDKYNGRILKVQKEEQFSAELIGFLERAHIRALKPEIGDLVQLSLEYGLKAVTEALEVYKEDYVQTGKDIEVDNLGGFIRNTIRRTFLYKTVA